MHKVFCGSSGRQCLYLFSASRRTAPVAAQFFRYSTAFSSSRNILTNLRQHYTTMTEAALKGGELSENTAGDVSVQPEKYPQATRDESIVDDFHGINVSDPYRWLEDPDSPATKKFVDELNAVSYPFLESSDVRETLREKLTKLWDYEKFGCTSRHGDFYYYYHNTGLQNQWVYYQQKDLNDKGSVFLDANKLSADGTTAIQRQSWTDDGKIFAYGLSEKGSDWVTIKFRTCSGEDLPDVISGVKFGALDWLPNNDGVFYSKYPEFQGKLEGSTTEKLKYHSLYFHKMGTDCKEDILVAQFPENENLMTVGSLSEDGRYLIVESYKGCDPTTRLYYFDLASIGHKITGKLDLKPLFTKADAKYDFIDNDGDSALIQTNHNASMFKLIRVKLDGGDWDAPEKWETVIPEDPKRKMGWVTPVAHDKLMVAYIEDVKMAVYVHDLATGKLLYQIPLDIGSVGGSFFRKNRTEFFLSFESFLVPSIIYRGDFAKANAEKKPVELEEIRRVDIDGLNADQFAVKQVFYSSKDGTKVPMYIISGKNVELNGSNPTQLCGYGGFNIADLPGFSISRLCFVRHFGAIVATANLRGGSEYGENWHQAGMLDKKQNVFDDFIAAAEYLIQNKYTNPSRLAIHGGSNGGLLVAACSQQRPDLFGAALNRVGVLDMLRFHKFTIGSAWLPEFGNPEQPDHFEFIYKYSPLHNLKIEKEQQFPATLLMTADHDDRVVPSHTLKYIAQLYHLVKTEANWQRKPILARIEVKAGHGAGKPTSKVIAEIVDMYCFLQRVLKLEWKD